MLAFPPFPKPESTARAAGGNGPGDPFYEGELATRERPGETGIGGFLRPRRASRISASGAHSGENRLPGEDPEPHPFAERRLANALFDHTATRIG